MCQSTTENSVCCTRVHFYHSPSAIFFIKAFLACHTQSASLIHTQLCSSPMHRRLCMCQSTTENSVCCTRVHFYHSPSAIFFIKAFLACHTQSASLIHTQLCSSPMHRRLCMCQSTTENSVCCTRVHFYHSPSAIFFIKAFLACHTQSASLIHTQLCSSPMHRRLCMCQSTTENSVCCTRVHFYHSPSAIFLSKHF